MSCGIYKIENLINGKVYIGQSINIERRWTEHRTSNKNPNSLLSTALKEKTKKHFQRSTRRRLKKRIW